MRYWKRVNELGETTTVESYSFDADIEGAIEITKAEFDAYIASLPTVKPPLPLSFSTFTHGLPDRVEHIEEFLKAAFP